MDQRMAQLRGGPIHHHVLVDLDVGHGRILILQAAFKTAPPFAKQRQFPEARIAMPQDLSEKIHLQANGIPVHLRVLQRAPNFFNQFRRQSFIRIEQQNPIVRERQCVHGPLALLRPTPRIMKLDHLRAARLRNRNCVVRALGIDDIHFTEARKRFQAARQVAGLIAHRNDYAYREHLYRYASVRYLSL